MALNNMNQRLLKEISDYFKKDLNLFEDEMKSLLYKDFSLEKEFQKEVLNFLFSKSKRLRPLIIFLIKDLFNFKDEDKKITKLATALELLHSATLIHDDIIDEAMIRRQNPAFNYKYNSKIAVILGDYLLSLSLKLLSEIGSPSIFSYFSDNTLKICRGEINQFFSRGKIINIEEYIEKSKNKTSSLFMAGAKSVLYLINQKLSIENIHKTAILDFVLNFSLAFQIYDDIRNFESDFEMSKKDNSKISSDIKNGIYTLPFLYLSQQNNLYDIINLSKESNMYIKTLEFSKNYLNNILTEAKNSIKQMENEYNINFFIKLTEAFKI